LATSNLKQEFDKYRAAGQTGIPRSELLAHLAVRRPPQHPQRSVQSGHRLSRDAHRRAAL
jgi:hypothetical protein